MRLLAGLLVLVLVASACEAGVERDRTSLTDRACDPEVIEPLTEARSNLVVDGGVVWFLDENGHVKRVPGRGEDLFGQRGQTEIDGIDDQSLLVGRSHVYGETVSVLNFDGSPGPQFDPTSQLPTDRDWVYFVSWYDPLGPPWMKFQSVLRVPRRTTRRRGEGEIVASIGGDVAEYHALTVDDEFAYWTTPGFDRGVGGVIRLLRAPKSAGRDSTPVEIAAWPSDVWRVDQLHEDGGRLYALCRHLDGTITVDTVPIAGGNPEQLLVIEGDEVIFHGHEVLWSRQEDDFRWIDIERASLDPESAITTEVRTLNGWGTFAVDDEFIYTGRDRSLVRYPRSCGTAEVDR